jgi:hypothetical protein
METIALLLLLPPAAAAAAQQPSLLLLLLPLVACGAVSAKPPYCRQGQQRTATLVMSQTSIPRPVTTPHPKQPEYSDTHASNLTCLMPEISSYQVHDAHPTHHTSPFDAGIFRGHHKQHPEPLTPSRKHKP